MHATNPEPPRFELMSSRGFPEWLAGQRASLAFTTYQAGKLFLLGLQPDGRLSIFERTFNRSMGLWGDGQTLWMSSLYQLWRFENTLLPGQQVSGYDRFYVPQVGYTTSDLDIHDIAVTADGRPVFVNCRFNCLATTSETHSFTPVWLPPFIDKLVPEDRCHLNGLALVDGKPRYVTAVSRSNVVDGWRDRRADGGCVVDVDSGEVVLEGLSMPHSPRWHDGKLWLLESGTRLPRHRRRRQREARTSRLLSRLPARPFLPARARGRRPLSPAREPYLLRALRSTTNWPAAMRNPAADCKLSTWRAATVSTGSALKASSANFTTSSCCPASFGRWPSASNRTKSPGPSRLVKASSAKTKHRRFTEARQASLLGSQPLTARPLLPLPVANFAAAAHSAASMVPAPTRPPRQPAGRTVPRVAPRNPRPTTLPSVGHPSHRVGTGCTPLPNG